MVTPAGSTAIIGFASLTIMPFAIVNLTRYSWVLWHYTLSGLYLLCVKVTKIVSDSRSSLWCIISTKKNVQRERAHSTPCSFFYQHVFYRKSVRMRRSLTYVFAFATFRSFSAEPSPPRLYDAWSRPRESATTSAFHPLSNWKRMQGHKKISSDTFRRGPNDP